MKGPYERKPTKEKKAPEIPVTHCKTCKHFRWGLITAFYDTDGTCDLRGYSKHHDDEACGHWERK